MGVAGARATPSLSRPVIDRFMTGGNRTNVSQIFFIDAAAIGAASRRRKQKM
jgi:hypothetical protein